MCFVDEIYLSDLVLFLKFNGEQTVCVTTVVVCVHSGLQKYQEIT